VWVAIAPHEVSLALDPSPPTVESRRAGFGVGYGFPGRLGMLRASVDSLLSLIVALGPRWVVPFQRAFEPGRPIDPGANALAQNN
jgi:hypothetical protein